MSHSLTRRKFMTSSAASLGAVASLAPLSSYAKDADLPNIEWRLTSSYPKSLDIIYGAALYMSERVATLSGGRFKIQIFAPQEIAPGLEALNVVSNGTVEMCHTASYYYVGKDEAFVFGTCIPFGMNTRQTLSWIYGGGGEEILQRFYDQHNVKFFVCGATGAQMGGWFRKPIDKVSDLQGVTFRIAGLAGRILEKMGVIPQQIAGGDIYPALEKGTIDAAEWICPYDDEKLGFHKVAKHYYYPGWWEGGSLMNTFVNKPAWDKLPRTYQEILKAACFEATGWMTAQYDHHNPPALRRIAAQGVHLHRFSNEIMQEAFKTASELYEEIAQKNPSFKEIWTHYQSYMKESILWHRFAEGSYDYFNLYQGFVKG